MAIVVSACLAGAVNTSHEVALLRLVAQRLAGPALPGAAEAVAWLGAVQAQDYAGALTSVALRTRARSRGAVEASLDAGAVVRSWPMRGTLHLVPAVDLPWMLAIARTRTLAQAARRREQLGLDESTIARARAIVVEHLTDGRSLTRAEVLGLWEAAGLAPAGGRGYHLLFYLALTGVLCLGPVCGAEQAFVLLEEWVPRPARPERDEALGEWAVRFFRSHGPATAQDFSRWTGLFAADARAGIAVARTRLATLDVDGVEHLLDPGTPDLLAAHRAAAREVLLLPGFDELILGYADRTHTLTREHEARVVPGGNGVFAPTVVADGRVVGTWRRIGRGKAAHIETTPFGGWPGGLARAVEVAAAALPVDGAVRASQR